MDRNHGIEQPRTDPLQQVPKGQCISPAGADAHHVVPDSNQQTPSSKTAPGAQAPSSTPQAVSAHHTYTAVQPLAPVEAPTRQPKQQDSAHVLVPAVTPTGVDNLHPAQAAATAAATAAAAAAAAADSAPTHQHSQGNAVPLSSLCVFLHGSIPMLQRRLPIISRRLQQLGITLAPPNALNTLTSSKTGSSSSSRPSSKLRAVGIRRSSGTADSSSSSSNPGGFDVRQISHIVLHAPGDSSSGGSGGSNFKHAAAGPRGSIEAAAAAGLDMILKQAQLLRRQQQQQQQQHGGKGPSCAGYSADLCHLVSDGWLDAVLAAGQYVPEKQYSLEDLIQPQAQQADGSTSRSGGSSSDDVSDQQRAAKRPRFMPDLDPAPDAPMGRFAMWLGRWEPRFNSITTQVEFVLQAKYSVSDSLARGPNERVRAALKELADYEEAIGGSKGDPGVSNLNHEALTFAHAAAVVRGCAFPLSPSLQPAQLQRLLPFVGAFVAKIIHQLLTTGTCEQLQCFRQNLPVTNSRGELRPNTAGGATRALFNKLPGVGPIMAEKWFKAGFRSIESLLDAATAADKAASAAAAGSQLPVSVASRSSSSISGQYSIFPLGRAAMYSLQHSSDLLEVMEFQDITEMKQEVLKTLTAVTPGVTDGWVMQQVGGAVRGGAVHDADWLITNNKCDPQLLEGLVTRVYDHMVWCGRLVPQEEGFCRIQVGKLEGYKEKARKDLLEKTNRGNRHQLDHYDHIWGIYLTQAGKRRRMDLIFVPPDCHSWVFAFIGWSGSKQYLRFMRTHAGNCGMFLNSHFMMREVLLKPSAADQAAAAAAAAGAALSAPGSRWQQQQTLPMEAANIQRQDLQHRNGAAAAAAVVVTGTCNGCRPSRVDLRPALRYATAAAAAGSFKSVVLSVPDEVPPCDSSGKEWWPPGWCPEAAAAAAIAGPSDEPDDSTAAHRAHLCMHVLAGAGTDRPVTQERDLFELLGIPYRPPHERCC